MDKYIVNRLYDIVDKLNSDAHDADEMHMRLYHNKHYSDEAIKMIQEYENKTSSYQADYVFEVWCIVSGDKDNPEEYIVSYEIMHHDIYDGDKYTWEDDWFEGQQNIQYKRMFPLDYVLEWFFKHNTATSDSDKE